ncbi:MAG: methyltransferase domain-containing protein [Verrucomicrobia bacterium]|nr:MAG: methyltransferase domain-containing protein [Verrucomicrobiota bacterium]TAE88972.1 MAG: methyltransferase domain-containing protein [Verrucomicrobiota bacterium]TAF27404.1 MAG: methyltransferase domain-containing protein [Verrucomicrobiota bacterium]TAF42482.1 MAG: methyltransferase domain-containing protein [Verrucomicrobiota bacterium]
MSTNPYESDRLLAEYLLFHYGSPAEILPVTAPAGMRDALDFAVRTTRHFSPGEVERSLDLGCAVGRSTYELSRHSRETIGIDFSQNFVRAAAALAAAPLAYRRLDEAHHHTDLDAKLPQGLPVGSVSFECGDAMDLRPDLGDFDRVHAANLLCRLPDPCRLLARLPHLVRPEGELVLATPCTWLGEFTPPANWPPHSTLEWLVENLGHHFELLDTGEEPFLIRETARKFQWTSSLLSVWKRKNA